MTVIITINRGIMARKKRSLIQTKQHLCIMFSKLNLIIMEASKHNDKKRMDSIIKDLEELVNNKYN